MAYAVALQSLEGAKKIVVAGYAYTGTGSSDFAVARYPADRVLLVSRLAARYLAEHLSARTAPGSLTLG